MTPHLASIAILSPHDKQNRQPKRVLFVGVAGVIVAGPLEPGPVLGAPVPEHSSAAVPFHTLRAVD